MDEDEWFFETLYPLSRQRQERIDRILLAMAGRHFELGRDATSAEARLAPESWQPEAARSTTLGKLLTLLAQYVDRPYLSVTPTQIEQAMERILRIVFGNPFDEGYTVPAKFHTTELGKLFHDAYSQIYSAKELLTVKETAHFVGVVRQSVYDRIADGKLHPIYFYGDQRLVRKEVKEWKVERDQRKQANG